MSRNEKGSKMRRTFYVYLETLERRPGGGFETKREGGRRFQATSAPDALRQFAADAGLEPPVGTVRQIPVIGVGTIKAYDRPMA